MYVCMNVRMYVYMYICMYVICMYVYINVCTYVCMYICMYVRMYAYFFLLASSITLGNTTRFVHIVGYLIYQLHLIHISVMYDSSPMYLSHLS